MARPAWYSQLLWEGPYSVAMVNGDRKMIPDFPGCYAFTTHPGALSPGKVVYVGESRASLATRLPVYLVDWRVPKLSESHKGKGFVLEARQQRGDNGVFIHWVRYGGAPWQVSQLEASLIDYLKPSCNDRDEEVRHGLLDHTERLDRRALL